MKVLNLALTAILGQTAAVLALQLQGGPERSRLMTSLKGSEQVPLLGGCARRNMLLGSATSLAYLLSKPVEALAAAPALQDSLDIDTFLRTGQDMGGNMGVSSQAGKSRPQTGIIFRDGSDVNQDNQGNVLAEILVGKRDNYKAVLTSFSSPWPLAKGPVFDVECRDASTGDSAFLAVSQPVDGKSLADLPSSFFLERLFDPTGRFSFYGSPTDIKVKRSTIKGDNRVIELSFSNLSQATNAEIPRKAILVATIPPGTDNAIMLVGSASASRWAKADATIRETVESFRAIAAPKTNLKLRPKDRGFGYINL